MIQFRFVHHSRNKVMEDGLLTCGPVQPVTEFIKIPIDMKRTHIGIECPYP